MKKLFAIALITLTYTYSFANDIILQGEDAPPPPPSGPGTSDSSVDFIIPFLLISTIFLIIYTINKNKQKIKTV